MKSQAAIKKGANVFRRKSTVPPRPAVILHPGSIYFGLKAAPAEADYFVDVKDRRGKVRRIYHGTARIKPTRYPKAHDGGEMLMPVRWHRGEWGVTKSDVEAIRKAREKRVSRGQRNLCIAAGVSNTALVRLVRSAYAE